MTLSQTVTTAASLLENNMKHKSERMIKGRMRIYLQFIVSFIQFQAVYWFSKRHAISYKHK